MHEWSPAPTSPVPSGCCGQLYHSSGDCWQGWRDPLSWENQVAVVVLAVVILPLDIMEER